MTALRIARHTVTHNINGRFKVRGFIGHSQSFQDDPEQTTLTLDAYDVNGYSYDYTSPNAPVFNYGKVGGRTVDQACYWQVSSSTAKGDASLVRVRPSKTINKFGTITLDFDYAFSDDLHMKFGVNRKNFRFKSVDLRRSTTAFGENITAAVDLHLPAGAVRQYRRTVQLHARQFGDRLLHTHGHDARAFSDRPVRRPVQCL